MINYDFFWLISIFFTIVSIVVILFITIKTDTPKRYSRLPVYIFLALSTFAIFLILSISLFPSNLFADFPISTIKVTSDNATQWVLNIGGVSQHESSGIQIPIFVIILGIIGAYIRYLYLGISEHKNKLGQMLFKLEKLYRKLDDSIKELKLVDGDPNNNKTIPPSLITRFMEISFQYKTKKDKIESKYNEYQYKLNFETISHVLHTVGFFLLAPLLSIMGWLILSIAGTENNMTFALVSITAGFTAKSIIGKAISMVEGQFKISNDKKTTPIIFLKPLKEKAGNTITVSGKHFKENSIITITFDGDELEHDSELKSDKDGSFVNQIQIPELEIGVYDISVKDEECEYIEKEFEVVS